MPKDSKKLLKIAALAALALLLVFYALLRSSDLIFGIKIKNLALNGQAMERGRIEEKVVQVTGNAQNAVRLALNGREIWIDRAGDFKETIVLLPGYNMISLSAWDKFGHQDEKNYQIITDQHR
jgi:hypothetical protein